MFVSTPRLYYFNWAFELKMVLFLVAVFVQLTLFRRVAGVRRLYCSGAGGCGFVFECLVWGGVGGEDDWVYLGGALRAPPGSLKAWLSSPRLAIEGASHPRPNG